MVQVQVLTAQFRDSCSHGPMTFSSLMGSGVGFNGETLNFWLRNDRFDSCTPGVWSDHVKNNQRVFWQIVVNKNQIVSRMAR